MAPNRACLARQATCRNAGLPTLPALVRKNEQEDTSAAKPVVVTDDIDMVSSPDMADFTVSEKALLAPHRHSRHPPHPAPPPTTDRSCKRARPRGGRRSDLQEEVRILLEEELDAMMDVDEDDTVASPSSAAEHATRMLLSRENNGIASADKEVQPAARRESSRVPVQKFEGKKRVCCSVAAAAGPMSISPELQPRRESGRLYGEVR